MHSFDHILCLLSEAAATAPALQQALYLACALDAPLHVGSVDALSQSTLDDLLAPLSVGGDASPAASPVVVPSLTGPNVSVHDVKRYVGDTGSPLVVTDTPPDDGPMPPLTPAATQTLVQQLDCSVFVVGQSTPFPSLDHLLVPTDLSAQTRPALTHAATLAALCDATVHLLHVIEGVPYIALTRMDRLSFGASSLPEQRARRRLAAFLNRDPPPDVGLESHFEYGAPADQIGRYIHRHEVDLLVMASHGPQTPPDAAMGHIPDRVLRQVACPLVLIRPPHDAPVSAPDASSPPHTTAT